MGSNFIASTSIGCLFCYKGCNADKLRNAFTFVPPEPSYVVEADAEDKTQGRIVYSQALLRTSAIYRQAVESSKVHWLTTRKGSQIPVVWMRGRGPEEELAQEESSTEAPPPLVLLHCHGNATDIGTMMGPYYEFAQVLGIEVLGVEYSGYGTATGKPSPGNTCADLEAAYDLLVCSGVSPERIVAYGQSVGSGPVAALATKRQLGGIILHSPLLSGIKVVDPAPEACCRPSCVWKCFDFYPNHEKIKSMSCPVLIMHGQSDDIIPFYHGYKLHEACPKTQRWPAYFPVRGGHNNLVETDPRTYFLELSKFLRDVQRIAAGFKVEPPTLERPQQVGMVASVAKGLPRISGGGAEAAAVCIGVAAGDREERCCAVTEPRAGPEDGRYVAARKGNILAVGGPRVPEKA